MPPSLTAPNDIKNLPALELVKLQVGLGPRRLSLDRPCRLTAGYLYLIVGRSGSGKSSFARALLGFGELSDPRIDCVAEAKLINATARDVVIWRDEFYDPKSRRHIAFLPQSERLGFIDALSVTGNLRLFSRLEPKRANDEIERWSEQLHVGALPVKLASASGGERIRLSAIRGLLPRDRSGAVPAVVIADEPTAGLDPKAAAAMAELLSDLARGGESVVIVITHEPDEFIGRQQAHDLLDSDAAQIIECRAAPASGADRVTSIVGKLQLEPVALPHPSMQKWVSSIATVLGHSSAIALSPLAFVWGLFELHRPWVLLRQVLLDALGLGTQAFSMTGCLLIAGTVAYFIFERMPKPELVEPLLLPEIIAVTGQALVRVVLPLGACSLVTAKLGAAQAARFAAAVRGGLLETLAMAGWRVESFALVPAVLAQLLAMAIATTAAIGAGVILAAMVYVAGHDGASLPLAISLMIDGLDQAPHWKWYAGAKVVLSSFLGGAIAALCGIAPSRAKTTLRGPCIVHCFGAFWP